MNAARGLSLVLAILLAGSAAGRDLFVDNLGGDDRNNGTSPVSVGFRNGPVRSIGKALRVASAGDRIHVNPNGGEPYRECVTLQGGAHSGSGNVILEIVGNGAVMDGSISLMEADWDAIGDDLFEVRPPKMAYQQLFLAGSPAERVKPAGSKLPELKARQWCLFEGKIVLRTEKGRLPTAYDPACCGHPVAITLYDVHDVVIRDLQVRGYQLDGVNAHDTATRIDIVKIDSSFNGRSGFSIGGASRVRLDGCTAAGNGVAQVRTEGYSRTAER